MTLRVKLPKPNLVQWKLPKTFSENAFYKLILLSPIVFTVWSRRCCICESRVEERTISKGNEIRVLLKYTFIKLKKPFLRFIKKLHYQNSKSLPVSTSYYCSFNWGKAKTTQVRNVSPTFWVVLMTYNFCKLSCFYDGHISMNHITRSYVMHAIATIGQSSFQQLRMIK